MAVLIAHASSDENKSAKGGQAGDQTGREVCIREWYNKPWNVMIRFKDPVIANKVAECMEMACANNFIGYDQNQRNSLLVKARKYNYNVSKVTEPCETDCSALVSVACMYAGIPESTLTLHGNCATTRTLRQILKSTGEVEIYTTPLYTAKSDKLKRGDILLKEGAHVVVVVKTEGNPYRLSSSLLKEGSMGESVKWLQYELNANGAKLNVDGAFGKQTKLAVLLYQKDHGLVCDGVVGVKTLEALKDKKPVKKSSDNEKIIWDYLISKMNNPYAVAGLMGNLRAESGLNPKNLQNTSEKKLGMNDEQYTSAIDNQTYRHFTSDNCGYGIAQWTSSGRKKALYEFRGNRSIGSLEMQLDFLWHELNTSYKKVLNGILSSSSVRDASDIVLTKFERPKDQSEAVKIKRANFGMEYFKKYGGKL